MTSGGFYSAHGKHSTPLVRYVYHFVATLDMSGEIQLFKFDQAASTPLFERLKKTNMCITNNCSNKTLLGVDVSFIKANLISKE